DDLMNTAHTDDFAGGAGNFFADAATFEFANGFAAAEELTGEVDGQNSVPLGEGHVFDGGILLQSCVGDEDVEAAEFVEGTLEHRFDFVFSGDVGFVD